MTTTELRRLFKADRRGDATCPLCREPRLCINHGTKKPGVTVVLCHDCGRQATRKILATKGLWFRDLFETDDPRYLRAKLST